MKKLMHQTKISIPEKKRIELVKKLNKTLASTTDLFIQLKQAHWNVKGMEFIALHKLFDEIAEEVEEQVDIVAERVTSLGGTALGTLEDTLEGTELKKYPNNIFTAQKHLEALTHNFAILGELARKNIKECEEYGDYASGDIYIALVRMLDKNLWFLEAHLQK